MNTPTLVDCLKLFNRKERYWLLKNALGSGENLSLPLNEEFLAKVLKAAAIPADVNRDDIWWAMDYHFDWLAAAIRVYATVTSVAQEHWQSELALAYPSDQKHTEDRSLVTGTQEDADFVIAFGNTVILLEAKGVTPWSYKQFKDKVLRIKDLEAYIKQPPQCEIELKFILMSPSFSEKLQQKAAEDMQLEHIEHIEMRIPDDAVHPNAFFTAEKKRFLKPTRCQEDSKADKNGKSWKIEPDFIYKHSGTAE